MAEIIASTYELIEKIGSGGGGTVYLANHLRLNKKVVLKADKRKVTARPELLRREVDVLKNLSHTYIPKVFDFFVEGETVYTVMDFIEGESLDKPLKRGEKFPQAQVIIWAQQLLKALDYLHTPIHGEPPKGYVHSDIKPANLMRTPLGDICLIDFNIALALGEENVVGCSAGYASPEHYGLDYSSGLGTTGITKSSLISKDEDKTALLDNDSTVLLNNDKTALIEESQQSSSPKKIVIPDVRSDIYSTGATLYHLLSGKRPASSALEVVQLSEKEFSPQIIKIISKAMNPNPELRYQSAAEMLYDFEHLRENDPRYKRLKRCSAITGITAGIVLIAGVFTTFVGLKRIQTTEEWLKLSEYSKSALLNGNAKLAVDYALQAIPERNGVFVPETLPEAQSALTDALGVYNLDDSFNSYRVIDLPSSPLCISASPAGKSFACVCSGEIVIADIETGEITDVLKADTSALSEVEFLNENTIIYAGDNGITSYDIFKKETLWVGEKATAISISDDNSTVAAIYKDNEYANIYNADSGEVVCNINFDDKHQSVAYNDSFVNPNNNLFALNSDGSQLAVSFSNGSLYVYDLLNSSGLLILGEQFGFTHFEGGFYQNYLAFSAANSEGSAFAIFDCSNYEQTGGFQSSDFYSVKTNRNGICVQTDNILVRIDPVTGAQVPLVTTNEAIRNYTANEQYALVYTNNKFMFFDKTASLNSSFDCELSADFLELTNNTAIIGFMDSPSLRILKLESHNEQQILLYDRSYYHDEARLSANEKSIMLFSYRGFRIYSIEGEIISDVELPDRDIIYDQQYVREGSNSYFEVTYYDGRKITYNASTGVLLNEEAVDKPSKDIEEEFFTDKLRIERSLHGVPCAYDIATGKLIAELEKDAYLTYITQLGEYVIAQYVTVDGRYYGVLMNEKCQTLARLPCLSDVVNGKLVFDYSNGNLRSTRIYTLSELVSTAHEKQ